LFERFFLQHPACDVHHEPLTDAYYMGPERTSVRFSEEEIMRRWPHLADATFEGRWQKAVTPSEGKKLCFVKDMAEIIYLPTPHADTARKPPEEGNPTLIPAKMLLDPGIMHVFLIRNLEDAFSSFEKVNSQPIIGDGHLNAQKLGVHELRSLYDFIVSKTPEGQAKPIVVNSDDLLDNTEAVVSTICKLGELEFDASLLKWEAKAANAEQAFGKWKGWHDDALASTGVDKTKRGEKRVISDQVKAAIEDCRSDWDWLAAKAHRFD